MARREVVLDAAIEVIAESGVRALTHRALDAAAGLPPGSTSNLFRTKDALLIGVVQRFVQREAQVWIDLAERPLPQTPRALAAALTAIIVDQVTEHRALTVARYTVLIESAHRPGVRAALTRGGAQIMSPLREWFTAAGSTRPAADAAIVANYVAGLVIHELANPASPFDPAPAVRSLVSRLLTSTAR